MFELDQDKALYEFGPFRMDLAERLLTKGQQVIPLTPKAFDTLVVLVRNSGHVVEKDELLKQVWPDTFVEEGVLAVNVAAIRKALTDGDEARSYIETVPRRGYRFVGEVHTLGEPSAGKHVSQTSQERKKAWLHFGALCVGLIVLVAAGVGWYLSRSRPGSTEPPSQPVPLTTYPGAELSPTFSPDGSQVAFSWNGPQQDNFDIYVRVVDRGDPARLTQNPDPDISPAWSPDGRQIAFIRLGSVFLISPLGGHERRLADVQAAYLAWTPDSKSLAVSSGSDHNYRILLVSAEAGDARPLVTPLTKGFSVGDISLAISPDGLKLAFARFPTGTTADLFVVPMTGGEPRRLTENGVAVWGIAWTPDGQELIYSSGPFNTAATLWRRRVDVPVSERSQRIDRVEESSVEPVIASPMQRPPWRVAYQKIMLDTNIWSTAAGLPNGRRVIASTRLDADPQFSPDGRRLAFSSDRSGIRQIWVANSDGSNPVQLTSFKTGFANAPRWSPDGQRIVFAAIIDNNRDIYMISADGGVPRPLTSELTEEGRPSWSRDNRWIYFYSTRSGFIDIFKMPAEGGVAEQVTTGGGHECFESPDGKLLYYQVGYSGLRSISTGQASPTQGPVFLPTLWHSWWAVTEKGIYFVEFNEKQTAFSAPVPYLFSGWVTESVKVSHPIQFYEFESRKATQIGSIEKELVQDMPGFSVTSDGRWMAWSQIDHAESDLMMIENFR